MPMKLLTASLCLVVLLTGCTGTAQRTNGTRQPTSQPRQPMTQTRQGADPECKQFGPGVYVDEPDYAPQATVANGAEAPADSLHGALKLPLYPEAVGVTTETREDQVVERYTVPTSNVVAARAALAQFYHHKMHDVGLVYQSPKSKVVNPYSRPCSELVSLLPYSFTFTDPGAVPNSRVQFEHTVFLQINQIASGQLEVTLSRSSPEAIERKLEEFVELQREATVVAKRSEVTGSTGSTSTRYYVTFQFADGLRAEYRVGSDQYGMLAEGDKGLLLTKGSRFQEFERHP